MDVTHEITSVMEELQEIDQDNEDMNATEQSKHRSTICDHHNFMSLGENQG